MRVKRLTRCALLTAIALTIFVLEAQIPIPFPVPGMKLGADSRDLNGRGVQKNGRMLRGGLQCRLLFRFLREGRNGQRGQQAQGEQQAETTFFHGDLSFFSVMLKMREAMIFHIFMVF